MIRITMDVDVDMNDAVDWVAMLFFEHPAFMQYVQDDIEIKEL